jgi:hypothetical protein
VLLLGLLCCAAPGASAHPDAAPADAAAAIHKDEADARAKGAAELTALAKFCTINFAFDDARHAYESATQLVPDDAVPKAEIVKLKNRKGTPSAAAASKVADRRAKCLAKCTELMAPVVVEYEDADRGDDVVRLVGVLRGIGAPVESLDVAWFAPYLQWRSKKDVERLQAGWEFVDGAWADPPKVAELDRAHTDWASPWAVTDEAYEVRTTLPLRTAREVLACVGSLRRTLLGYFAGEWDLRQPEAKLRVVVTRTRAEFDERLHADAPSVVAVPRDAEAWYADTPAAGNACFVAFEVLDARDRATKLDFAGVRFELQREAARQIAFEYSKHGKGRGRLTRAAVWAIEGLAELAPYLSSANGSVVVTHPSGITTGGHDVDSAASWCRANVDKIPPLEAFVALQRAAFMKTADENRRVAAALEWYLLEGNGRSRRAGFVKYLETVHQDRDEADSLAACLPGVSLAAVDGEFRAWCRALRVDEK